LPRLRWAFGKIKAVSPPPDGDYPGGNTAEGPDALFGLTSGGYNTAVGWLSLGTVSTGDLNTGVGAGTLLFNTADGNTATGAAALFSNSSGFGNTANGSAPHPRKAALWAASTMLQLRDNAAQPDRSIVAKTVRPSDHSAY
jgi:hypothetical protein